MGLLTRRIRDYLSIVAFMNRVGARLTSIFLYPVRRRVPQRRNQLDFKNGLSIACPFEESLLDLLAELWVNDCYQVKNCHFTPDDTIIDLGANVGGFTTWVASRNPGVRILSLEPSLNLCVFLRRNIARSGLHNITVIESACGGRSGEATLYRRGQEELLNTLSAHDTDGKRLEPLTRIKVLTLEEVFDSYDVQRCDFLKIDCEGSEYEILLNACHDTLRKVRRISLEYHVDLSPHNPLELARFLEDRGFQVELSPSQNKVGYLHARRHR